MESTVAENTLTEDELIKKNESATEFDELYQMDNLKLSETITELANSSNIVQNTNDSSIVVAGESYPRASSSSTGKPPVHTFSECNTSSFALRVGPNYSKKGNKAPAGASLYDVVGME